MNYTLTLLDTAAIQQYIFNSNELRENIGASHLVHLATTRWVQDALDDLEITHNYQVKADERQPYKHKNTFRINNMSSTPCAELLYAGGGNTFILFGGDNHPDKAKDFVYTLSRHVIREAPGLNIYATHVPYNWGENLPQAVKTAVDQLAQLKNRLPVYQPLLGLSVTAACTSTGLPANGRHPDPDKNGKNDNGRPTLANRASRQVIAQWHASWHNEEYKKHRNPDDIDANDRLRSMFPFVKEPPFKWTNDLDKIGKLPDRDESYIAVVHADGNGMGKRMLALSSFFDDNYPNQPRAYISAVRELSLAYQNTAQNALVRTICDLEYSLRYHENEKGGDQKRYYPRIEETKDNGEKEWVSYFPFRPVVFGGDDVTFVCASPWGVPLAKQYLSYLEDEILPSGEGLLACADMDKIQITKMSQELNHALNLPAKPFACAGVSIVKTHYPISRAYTNSSELADSAKAHVLRYESKKQASAIDWHITTTGISGSLEEIRQREYEATSRDKVATAVRNTPHMDKLTMRPLMLDRQYSWRNWDNFRSIYEEFDEYWFDSRNKVMALREALRGGPEATAKFTKTLRGRELPRIPYTLDEPIQKSAQKKGWVQPSHSEDIAEIRNKPAPEQTKILGHIRCAYFDAIELENQLLKLYPCPEVEKEAT